MAGTDKRKYTKGPDPKLRNTNPISSPRRKMRGEDSNAEDTKDFDRAYKSLGGKLDKKGASALFPERDRPALDRYQRISAKDHIRREELFAKIKNNNLAYL